MLGFSSVIGQAAAKERLRQEVHEGRVAHALLLCGPRGSGKLPLALAYARYLCCPNRTEEEACGRCPSCLQWAKLEHPDTYFSFPVWNKSKSGRAPSTSNDFVKQWRELVLANPYFDLNRWMEYIGTEKQVQIFVSESDEIIRRLSLKSATGGYKIVLVWLPEKMNEPCANKLLKLLEEPPQRTVFLLVSEEPDKVLPTIVSRTQPFRLARLSDEEIADALHREYGIEGEEAAALAHVAAGDFIKALDTIHLNRQQEEFFELFVSLMRLAWQRKIREMKLWSEQVARMSREQQKSFLEYAQRMTRENFICNFRRPEMNYLTPQEAQFATRFSPFVNERNVTGIMHELSEAQIHVEQNVNAKMVFFDFALKMIVLIKNR